MVKQVRRLSSLTLESVPERRSNQLQEEGVEFEVPRFVGPRALSWPITAKRPTRRGYRVTPEEEGGWKWEISEQLIETLPMAHPLSMLSLEVDLPLSIILVRISAFMRVNSIACVVNPNSASIDCETPCSMHFLIQFWKSTQSSIIIEIHRLQGCAIKMHTVHVSLLNAIKTGYLPVEEGRYKNWNSARSSQCQSFHQHDICGASGSQVNDVMVCLAETEELLQSHFDDQLRLGMENLVYLSCLSDASELRVRELARALLFNEGPFANSFREALFQYFDLEAHRNCSQPNEPVDTDDECEYSEIHMFNTMHKLALRVLVNVLEVSDSFMISPDNHWWRVIFHALEYNLREATSRPHEAALSIRCLLLLKSKGVDFLSPKVEHRLVRLLVRANRYGHMHHLVMELESRRLLQCLMS